MPQPPNTYTGQARSVSRARQQVLVPVQGSSPDIYTSYPELLPLVDYLALQIVQSSARSFQHRRVIRIVKATGTILKYGEKHELFALLATHPNVTPLEDGGYAANKEESEFVARSLGFQVSQRRHKLKRGPKPLKFGIYTRKQDKSS